MRDQPSKVPEKTSGTTSGLSASLFSDPSYLALYSRTSVGRDSTSLSTGRQAKSDSTTDTSTIDLTASTTLASLERRPMRADPAARRDVDSGTDRLRVGPPVPGRDGSDRAEAAISRSLRTMLAGKTGLPDKTTTKIAGVGSISVEARRHADTHKIEGLTIKLPAARAGAAAPEIDIRRDTSGKWTINEFSKLNPQQLKVLETMGVKPDKDGKFSGELEILKKGTIRYKDSDKADRKIYALKPDGGRSVLDHKIYTVTNTDAAGKVGRLGWNGKAYAALKPGTEPKVETMKDGSTRVTLEFAKTGGTRRPGATRAEAAGVAKVERITGGTNNLDRTIYYRSNPNAPGGIGRAHAYDWRDGARHLVRDDRGRAPTSAATEYFDGKTYRPGRKTGDTATGTTVTLAGSDRGSGVKSITTRGDVKTFKGDKFEFDKDRQNRVTRIQYDKGTMLLGRDAHGDINKIRMPDGRTMVRAGTEHVPGMDYRLSRREASLNDLGKSGKYNEWLVFDKDGKHTGKVSFNFGVSSTGEARFAHQPRAREPVRPPAEPRPPLPARTPLEPRRPAPELATPGGGGSPPSPRRPDAESPRLDHIDPKRGWRPRTWYA